MVAVSLVFRYCRPFTVVRFSMLLNQFLVLAGFTSANDEVNSTSVMEES